nr:hypothetical protein [Tessaracoccus antarcticus]
MDHDRGNLIRCVRDREGPGGQEFVPVRDPGRHAQRTHPGGDGHGHVAGGIAHVPGVPGLDAQLLQRQQP